MRAISREKTFVSPSYIHKL